MHSILIECLPAELPEKIDVDVSHLEIGNSINVSDIKCHNKILILSDMDAIVANVLAPKVEEEVEIEDDVEVVKKYYGYSNEKSRQILPLLSPQQIDIIRKKVSKGGRK